MNQPLWFHNLLAYGVQLGLLVIAGDLVLRVFRLRAPRVLIVYWQALLAVCVALPLLEPWRHRVAPVPQSGIAVTLGWVRFDNATAPAPRPWLPVSIYSRIAFVLLAGIVIRLLWLTAGLVRLHFYRRRARPLNPLPPSVEDVRSMLVVSADFRVSTEIESPVTCGEIRPTILFPPVFLEMEPGRQKAIACHELLHVWRHDWSFHIVEEILRAVFWFHPAMWWLIGRIRLAREQLVDSEVVQLLKSRKPYLEALLEIAAGRTATGLVPAPLFLAERQLPQRIAAMLKEVSMSKPRLIVSLAGMVGFLLLTGGLAVWSFPLQAPVRPSFQVAQRRAVPSPTTPTELSGSAEGDPAERPRQSSTAMLKPLKVGGDVKAPVPIYKPEPPYTRLARLDKVEGIVLLTIVVDTQGNVAEARVTKSLRKDMDESTVRTIKTWKFKPGTRNGKPVPVRVTVETSFRFF